MRYYETTVAKQTKMSLVGTVPQSTFQKFVQFWCGEDQGNSVGFAANKANLRAAWVSEATQNVPARKMQARSQLLRCLRGALRGGNRIPHIFEILNSPFCQFPLAMTLDNNADHTVVR
jgi:hypothetical protein